MRAATNLWKPAAAVLLCLGGSVTAFAQQGAIFEWETGFTLEVDDPRPLAGAVRTLADRYGWQVNYEDPPYTYLGDVRDAATPDYRKKHPKTKAGWGPRGGTFEFRYERPADAAPSNQPLLALQELIGRYNDTGLPGKFEVRRVSEAFHIEPVQTRDVNGLWVPVSSLLDRPVSLPEEERTALRTLELIFQQVSASGREPRFGTMPRNFLAHARLSIGASGEPAYEVVQRLLDATGRRTAWQLFCQPLGDPCVFNLRMIGR